jgi:hypothetical protein
VSSFSYRDLHRDTEDQIIRYAIGDYIKRFKSGGSHRDSNLIHLKEIIEEKFEKQITVNKNALKDSSGNVVERTKELTRQMDDLVAKKQSTMQQLDDNFQKYLDLIETTKRK